MSLANLLGVLKQGAQGYMAGQQQAQQLQRQAALDAMQAKLQEAQLANYQQQTEQQQWARERQDRMDQQAAEQRKAVAAQQTEQKQFEQAKGLLGLLANAKQWDAANNLAQTNPAIRRAMGLGSEVAGPVNLAFAAPPVSADTAARTAAQVQTAQIRAGATTQAASTRAAAAAAAPVRYVTDKDGKRVPDGPGVVVRTPKPEPTPKPPRVETPKDGAAIEALVSGKNGAYPLTLLEETTKTRDPLLEQKREAKRKELRRQYFPAGGSALTPTQQAIIDALK